MRLANAVVFLTFSFVALIGYGQQPECGRTQVVYANGVLNEPSDASDGLTALVKMIETHPAVFSNEERSRLDGALAFNPSTNAIVDLIEALDQAGISSETEKWRRLLTEERLSASEREAIGEKIAATILRGLSESQDQQQLAQSLFEHVTKYRDWINSGKKVVVVAHSQGNFFANQAYFFLSPSEQRAFAIVAVASPDSYVAKTSTPHVTQFGDDVINVRVAQELRNFNYPPPLSPNTPDSSNEGHNFIDTYLEEGSESATKIVSYLKSNIDALTNPLCDSNQSPIASFSASVGSANTLTVAVGQEIVFDPQASRDPDGTIVSYSWDFGEGGPVSTGEPTPQRRAYVTPGSKTVGLTVTDNRGATNRAELTITVVPLSTEAPIDFDYSPTPADTASITQVLGFDGRETGQAFPIGRTGQLTRVDVKILTTADPPTASSVYASVYAVPGPNLDAPTTAPLLTVVVPFSNLPGNTWQYVTPQGFGDVPWTSITLPGNGLPVSAGQQYLVAFWTEPSTANYRPSIAGGTGPQVGSSLNRFERPYPDGTWQNIGSGYFLRTYVREP